ncbi:MAG: galactose-1-phosphate uridylyltransferase, partial [Nakamurella sp.]
MTSTAHRNAERPLTRTTARMADGRELIYFDESPDAVRVLEDHRDLPTVSNGSEVRFDAITGEWV